MHTIPAPFQIYAYWAIALIIGFVFFRKDVTAPNPPFDKRRIGLLVFSVVILVLNAYIYSKSTTDGGRMLDPWSALIFSVGNGIAETFMFYAVFRIGQLLVGKFTQNQWAGFIVGFLFFMIYSGLIHGLFWLNILPEHVVQTSPFKPFFMPIQLMIALSWALSFFWYRDLRTVFVLHAIVDLTMIMNVKFSMFP
ncbi:MAG: chlorophyllide a hydrolase BciC [Chlorobaculum sp.]